MMELEGKTPKTKENKLRYSEQEQVGPYTLEILHEEFVYGACYLASLPGQEMGFLLRHIEQKQTGYPAASWPSYVESLKRLVRQNHPHILGISEVFSSPEEDAVFLVQKLPLLAAPDSPSHLGSLLRQQPNRILPESDAKAAISQLLRGVHFLHEQGKIHRALCPSILFLDWAQYPLRLQIGEFGLAPLYQQTSLPQAALPYAAPELQANSSISAHPRLDLYAVGAIFWELLHGDLPPKEPSEQAFQNIPLPLQSFFKRTLFVAPEKRASHGLSLLSLLEDEPSDTLTFAKEESRSYFTSHPRQAPSPPPKPWSQHHPLQNTQEREWQPVSPQLDSLGPTASQDLHRLEQQLFSQLQSSKTPTPFPHSQTPRPLPELVPPSWEQEVMKQAVRLQRQTTLTRHIARFLLLCLTLFLVWYVFFP